MWQQMLFPENPIDLFAYPFNNKLPRFVSVFHHLRAEAVDAFSQGWNRWENSFLFSPAKLLGRVVERLKSFRHRGLIVVSRRINASWFSYFLARGSEVELLERLEQSVRGKIVQKLNIAPQRTGPHSVYRSCI